MSGLGGVNHYVLDISTPTLRAAGLFRLLYKLKGGVMIDSLLSKFIQGKAILTVPEIPMGNNDWWTLTK